MQETWVQSLGQEESPGESNGNPLQYSCLENSMDEEPSRLQSVELQRVEHGWATNIHIQAHLDPYLPANVGSVSLVFSLATTGRQVGLEKALSRSVPSCWRAFAACSWTVSSLILDCAGIREMPRGMCAVVLYWEDSASLGIKLTPVEGMTLHEESLLPGTKALTTPWLLWTPVRFTVSINFE